MKENKKNLKKIRDKKDLIIGFFFIIFSFIFFNLMSFWIIISKIINFKNENLNNFPKIIKFIIKDKHYCFVIIIFLPVIIIIFYFRRMAQYSFRHSF